MLRNYDTRNCRHVSWGLDSSCNFSTLSLPLSVFNTQYSIVYCLYNVQYSKVLYIVYTLYNVHCTVYSTVESSRRKHTKVSCIFQLAPSLIIFLTKSTHEIVYMVMSLLMPHTCFNMVFGFGLWLAFG